MKEVGDFDKLKEAVDNIPTFAKVKECKDAYEAAKKALTTATSVVTKAENDLKPYTEAITEAENNLKPYTEAIEDAQETLNDANDILAEKEKTKKKIEDDGKTMTKEWTRSNERYTYSEYEDFYNALTNSEDGYNNDIKLYYGVQKVTTSSLEGGSSTTYVAVFATESIYKELKETNKNIIWDDEASGAYKGYFTPSDWAPTLNEETGVDEYGEQTKIPFKYNKTEQLVSSVRFYYINSKTGNIGFQVENADGKSVNNDYKGLSENGKKFIAFGFNGAYPNITRYSYTQKDIENPAYTEAKNAVTEAKAAVSEAKTNLLLAQNAAKPYQDAVAEAKNNARTWQEALKIAQNNKNAAATAVEEAKAEYNTEAAPIAQKGNVEEGSTITPDENGKLLDKDGQPIDKDGYLIDEDGLRKCEDMYTTISLTANISVSGVTGEYIWEKWPAGYTLNGNRNSVTSDIPLFDVNEGTIRNIANVQTSIATVNNGAVTKCLTRRDENTYRVYRASNDFTDYNSVEDAIYATQKTVLPFSYDMEKKEVLPYSEEYRLYQAHYANNANKKTYDFKLNIRSNNIDKDKFKYDETPFNDNFEDGLTFENAILYIDDNAAAEKIGDMKNVAVIKSGTYTCRNTELTDGSTAKGFYVPMPFKAENLSYDRDFKSSSLATVCLPFSMSKKTLAAAGVTQVMQFDNVDSETNTYWFRYLEDGELKANEPCVLKFDENFTGGTIFADLKDINVAATVGINQLAVQPSNPGDGAEFRGVFVATNATELANGGNLYGFAEGKFRPLKISEDTKFSPFRTYVRASRESNVPAVTFNIGELDEDGNIVSDGGETGVTTAVKEADAFSVKGINGALVITSDKAQKVNVYTIGGSLVKATNVEAGTMTVPVAAGVYVVNGKKVFVK